MNKQQQIFFDELKEAIALDEDNMDLHDSNLRAVIEKWHLVFKDEDEKDDIIKFD
jgi:hypothetical protein